MFVLHVALKVKPGSQGDLEETFAGELLSCYIFTKRLHRGAASALE